jgi:D-glycero-D-manno-heptose 1,7-bisphosphate phosphatase
VAGNRALFLDRDGVINIERGYLHRQEEFEFREGIFEVCRSAQALGYLLLVVTNQAGIARGYYTETDFLRLTDWMLEEFGKRQVRIARVYYCPYHPVHGLGHYRLDSPDRKPKPGMLFRAQADFGLDLRASVLIGDKLSDIQAAQAAGVGTIVWLTSRSHVDETEAKQCYVEDNLGDVQSRLFDPRAQYAP